uniref:Fibronectin type-III domain-containing protein n=1 Tax=Amphiprion percula TaxID=161767 RepID=A0A3P8S0C6_AMPPE
SCCVSFCCHFVSLMYFSILTVVLVSMDSVDMRHTLRWRPPQASCNTTVLYSVQYQGEFELLLRNGSWLDAAECQQIPGTHCDLSLDLGSDSDYNLQVRAQCGSQRSAWTRLSRAFNRRDSKTRASRQSSHFTAVFTPPPKNKVFSCAAAWKRPTTVIVIVIVIVMAGLLFALFWSVVHCRPDACQTYFHKEPLPQSLKQAGTMFELHYIAKSIGTLLQVIEFRCSNHFRGHSSIKSKTSAFSLLLQTLMKERVTLRSSVNSSVAS